MPKKAITTEEFEALEAEIWREFLSGATQEALYKSVITCNWDDNGMLLDWIRDNPTVDKGTILAAYWMSAPKWFKQYADRADCLEKASRSVDNFDFVEAIEQNYINGFYQEGEIAFDPTMDADGYDWTTDYSDVSTVRTIPPIMFEKTNGNCQISEMPEDFDTGLPLPYMDRIMALFDEYDVQ